MKSTAQAQRRIVAKRRPLLDAAALKGDIDFGIIAVKFEEYDAAIAQRFPIVKRAQGRRRYGIAWLDSDADRGYWVACIRCSQQGQGIAQQVADDLIDDLSPKWVVLLGIGGALPSAEYSLGDVIIANRVYDYSVQAVVHGRGPQFDTNELPLHRAARDVIEQLPDILRRMLGWNRERTIGRKSPGLVVPRKADDRRLYGPPGWKEEVIQSLRVRFDREHQQPKCWPVSVASGNTLVKDVRIILPLRTAVRTLGCVEMELAGVMRAANRRVNDVPVLGLRGVSDVVGFKRDEDWTVYACHTVAALAHALLRSGELLPPRPKHKTPVSDSRTSRDSKAAGASADMEPALRRWFEGIIRDQKRRIENRPLLRNVAARESFAFLFPEVFVNPRIILRKNPRRETPGFTDWMRDTFKKDVTIAVIGPSGGGKTTCLIHMYLEHAENFLSGVSNIVPIFVELRLMRRLKRGDRREIIGVIVRDMSIALRPMPSEYRGEWKALFFLDGLDEYLAIANEEERKRISGWPVLKEWHLLGTRSEAYFRLLENTELERIYSEVVELEEWSVEQEVRTFVEGYFRKAGNDWRADARGFEEFLLDNDLTTIATTPLNVTMLVAIWRHEHKPREVAIGTRSDLYRRFFDDWVASEAQRDPTTIQEASMLIAAFKRAAWTMYHWEREYPRRREAIDLEKLSREVASSVGVGAKRLMQSRAFLSLLNLRERPRGGARSDVTSFRHESLQAFLVAEVLIDALIDDRPSLEGALQTSFTYEVNTFVRERLEKAVEGRPLIAARLVDIYSRNIAANGLGTPRQIQIRNGAMYYLGRIGSERLRELYERARSGVEHPHVIGTMASGLMLMNDEACEVDYLSRLKDSHPDDVRTRKYHLVYYGDLPDLGPESYLSDIPRRNADDWKRTRAALVRRMTSRQERDLRLRALDLIVLRRLCETRAYTRFSEKERAAIAGARSGIEILPEYKQELIKTEVERILSMITAGND